MTLDEMANELRNAGYRVDPPISKAACKHQRARGSCSMGADGSGESNGYCPDCGHSWHYKHPRDPNYKESDWLIHNNAVTAP